MLKKNNTVLEKSLLSLTWPIFIDTLFVFLVSVVDALFLSKISDTAAASVGAVLPVSALFFSLFFNLSWAGNCVASQRIGADDQENLSCTYGTLIIMSTGLGIGIAILMITLAYPLALLMGLKAEMAGFAAEFIGSLGFGAFFLALRYTANAILASQGKTHWNMCSTAIMTLANLVFNYIFVFGKCGIPPLGIKGVALASAMAWFLSLLFSSIIIFRVEHISVHWPQTWQKLRSMSQPIFRIGLPSIAEPISWHFTQLVIIAMVVQMGEIALATRMYAYNILFVIALFIAALSAGVQLKVAHFVGAARLQDAHRYMLQGLGIAGAGILILLISINVLAPTLFGFFTDNSHIIELGCTITAVAILAEIGRALNLITGASLKASGDAKYISFWGLLIMWLVSVPLAWLLGIYASLGLLGLWLAMGADELIRGAIAWHRWSSKKWHSKGLYAK